tara:strand:- start:28101 stop:28553 length:453 start_codon:yes stop_codon:yes gene_type:complete
MNDIGIFYENSCFDLKIQNGDLAFDNGLETAVTISIFSDKRVTEDELPDLMTSKRGWWGDMFPVEPNDQLGSRLWTMERDKILTNTLRRSEELIRESLQWMLEDGVARSISVTSSFNENKILISEIFIERPNEDQTRFQINWEAQEVRRV